MTTGLTIVLGLLVCIIGSLGQPTASPNGANSTSTPSAAPATSCNPSAVMFVLDESSSISSPEFTDEKDWAESVTRSLFARGQPSIGLVAFASSSRLVRSPTSSESSIISSITNLRQDKGLTCIACGITRATSALRSRNEAKVAIIVTDGVDNDLDELYNALVAANSERVYRVAVGVGRGANKAVLDYIASNLPNSTAKASFSVENFASLSTVVDTVSSAACTDFAAVDFSTPIPRDIPGYDFGAAASTFGRIVGIVVGLAFAICIICIIAIVLCVCCGGMCAAASANSGGKTVTTTTTTTTEAPMTTIQTVQQPPPQAEFVPVGQPVQPQVTHVEHHTTYAPSPYNTGPPQGYPQQGYAAPPPQQY